MKISIIIPVYGVEKYIGQLFESIIKQTNRGFEIIFVDDGSPDNCPVFLDHFAEANRFCKVIHQANCGVSVARNTGLKYATGEYVYIADSDDWLEPTAVETFLEAVERTDADLIYTDFFKEYDDRTVQIHNFTKEFYTTESDVISELQRDVFYNFETTITNPVFGRLNLGGGAPWRVLIRRELIEENGLEFDPYVKGLSDDVLFSLNVFEYVKSVAYVQIPTYHYRIVKDSLSHGYKADLLERYARIFEKYIDFYKQYSKNAAFAKASYLRILKYFFEAVPIYFKNDKSDKSQKERYKEMKAVLKSEPYCSAIKNAPLNTFTGVKIKINTYLLRMGLYCLYWIIT